MHVFPYGYYASDTFQHQVRADAIKDAGNFRNEAFYISKGAENIVGHYPPLIYHISIIFSYAAGIEAYDAIYFIVFFFAIVGITIMYLIIKDFNRHIALISLPLAIIMFTYPLLIGFTWGHWPSVLAQSFLIVFAWCLMKIELKHSFVLISIAFSSVLLTHTSEGVFAFIFMALFFAARFIAKKLNRAEIKNIAIAMSISFIASVYYVIIFMNTWSRTQPYTFLIEPLWDGNPGFYIANFGIILIFIIAGIIFSSFKLKEMHTSIIFAFAMLLSGFLNYVGFGLRSFQIRFFWPVYLSVFFGFGIYMLLKIVFKKWSIAYTITLSLIFVLLLMGYPKISFIPSYTKSESQGIMDSYHWSALKWLSNTEPNSKIYFFYSDIYDQDAVLRNTKRFHYLIDRDSFVNAIQEKKIKRYYTSELPGDSGGGIITRTGIFSFEDATTKYPQDYFFGPQDICKFDYIVLDKPQSDKDIRIYNMLVASELLKKNFIEKKFDNEATIILKNNKIGADCIEERSF